MSGFQLHGMVLRSGAPIFLNIIKFLNNIQPQTPHKETFFQGEVGLGLEQHGLVEGIPAHGKGVGTI